MKIRSSTSKSNIAHKMHFKFEYKSPLCKVQKFWSQKGDTKYLYGTP